MTEGPPTLTRRSPQQQLERARAKLTAAEYDLLVRQSMRYAHQVRIWGEADSLAWAVGRARYFNRAARIARQCA